MTTTPTPEQFLSEPLTEEDDLDLPPTAMPGSSAPWSGPTVDFALISIAESLRVLVGMARDGQDEEKASDRLRELHDDLDAKAGAMAELIEEISEIVKPSTSKLAISVREAIARWSNPELPAEPAEDAAEEPIGSEVIDPFAPPADDAPVEAWRAHARRLLGVRDGDPAVTDSMNRSQIRTHLGIEQPVPQA